MARLTEENLYELISREKEFEIPIYQRNYDWTSKEIKRFFNDIFENHQRWQKENFDKNDSAYYVGNIILYDHYRKGDDTLMVVDGQQRLTSTIIIFAAIRKIINQTLNEQLKEDSNDFIEQVEKIIYNGKQRNKKLKHLNESNLL